MFVCTPWLSQTYSLSEIIHSSSPRPNMKSVYHMATPKCSYKHSSSLQNILKSRTTLQIRPRTHTVFLTKSSDSFVNKLLTELHLLAQAGSDFLLYHWQPTFFSSQRTSIEGNGNYWYPIRSRTQSQTHRNPTE